MKKIFLFFIGMLLTSNLYSDTLPVSDNYLEYGVIKKNDAIALYLGKIRYWSGYKIQVYMLPINNTITTDFIIHVLGITPTYFQNKQNELNDSGKESGAIIVNTQVQMLLKVGSRKGNLGYLSNDYVLLGEEKGLIKILKIVD